VRYQRHCRSRSANSHCFRIATASRPLHGAHYDEIKTARTLQRGQSSSIAVCRTDARSHEPGVLPKYLPTAQLVQDNNTVSILQGASRKLHDPAASESALIASLLTLHSLAMANPSRISAIELVILRCNDAMSRNDSRFKIKHRFRQRPRFFRGT